MSGLSRTPGKRVGANNPPRVRIPPSPPKDVFTTPQNPPEPQCSRGFCLSGHHTSFLDSPFHGGTFRGTDFDVSPCPGSSSMHRVMSRCAATQPETSFSDLVWHFVGGCEGQERPVAALRASQAIGRICDLSFVMVERPDDIDPKRSYEVMNWPPVSRHSIEHVWNPPPHHA